MLIVNCVGNKKYTCSGSDSNFIKLHDENYNVIKKIEEINGTKIPEISEKTINVEKRELYLLDSLKIRIIVTDFELNFIKYIGSKGDGYSICFKNGFLYVVDSYN